MAAARAPRTAERTAASLCLASCRCKTIRLRPRPSLLPRASSTLKPMRMCSGRFSCAWSQSSSVISTWRSCCAAWVKACWKLTGIASTPPGWLAVTTPPGLLPTPGVPLPPPGWLAAALALPPGLLPPPPGWLAVATPAPPPGALAATPSLASPAACG